MSHTGRANGTGPRVLMVNKHSSRNAGDAALTQAAIDQLRRNFPGCSLTLAMNDPDEPEGDERVIASLLAIIKEFQPGQPSRWRWWALPSLGWLVFGCLYYRWTGKVFARFLSRPARHLLQAYCEADFVVSCPGGYLYSSGRIGLSLIMAVSMMALAWVAGKPLYLLPQSIEPLASGWERALVGWVLGRARLVMVREAMSLAQAPMNGEARRRLHQFPDMAWTFAAAPREAAVAWLAQQGVTLSDRPILGITAINWEAQKAGFQGQARYERALAAAARMFVQQYGGRVVFFAQVCGPTDDQDDRVPARRVIARAGLPPNDLCLVEDWTSAAQLKAAYALMEVFIGTRMHSNIFALSGGVPVIAIGYQNKTRGIAQTAGVEGWVLDINSVDETSLTHKLAELWQARQQIRAQLAQRLPALVREAEAAGALMATDFTAWRKART